MRIAMLGVKSIPAIGGIARYVEELGARLAERGHAVTVYCRPHYLEGEGPYRGMGRMVVRGLRGKHLDAITHTYAAVRHAVRAGYDILHFHAVGPALLTPLARRGSKAAVVVTAHGPDWEATKWGPVAKAALKFGAGTAARYAPGWVAVSESVADKCESVAKHRPLVIPSGANRAAAPPPEEITRLGLKPGGYVFCAARLTPEKGLHYLVEAYRHVQTDKQLVIAGDCPHKSQYAARLRANADGQVLFTGYVQGRRLEELFGHAYLYCQPSDVEGLPMAVLEAMSHGRCVLASNIDAHLEALDGHGQTFRAGDVIDLAGKIQSLIANSDRVRRLGHDAQAHVLRHRSWDTTTDHYERLYLDLLRRESDEEAAASAQTRTRPDFGRPAETAPR